ncbi:MAG: histidine--tRNA ligase [Candidatus Omnitrophica bacterium]|jgi:histidyl-tRNA synthetase|nr:histidine--tRNA ligase [Candidatus Omnitrophota bacterium]
MFKKVSGTKDILPGESCYWQRIEEISRDIFRLYNFKEIRTPIIEDLALFNRCLGEFTEIVQKQMFVINNKDESYVLRPEGTASIARAYIENNLDKTDGLAKLFYIGPMFRLERPQKGRLRQFHHIGTEIIGCSSYEADVETIALANRLLKAYGIEGYEIIINNLGCSSDKQKLIANLKDKLQEKLNQLCPECNIRFNSNALRILDCKEENCQKIIRSIDIANKHLCAECDGFFKKVIAGLENAGVNFKISPYLVRGLDYYTRTVFEIKHSGLGAQDAIGAGGRYDNLIKQLGGPDKNSVGFAFGVERLMLAAQKTPPKLAEDLVYAIGMGEKARLALLKITENLRDNAIPVVSNLEDRSLKAAMRQANDQAAKYVLILGDNELEKNVITVKNMSDSTQKEISIKEIATYLSM